MENYRETLDFLKENLNGFKPEIAIVLGSGLGCFCDGLDGIKIPYSTVPNFPQTSIEGHKGEFLFSEINNKKCAIMQGRFHFYEGFSMQSATYPIKILKMLGVKHLFLTNAAGTTVKDYNIGDIMLIKDHINFMGSNPLIGKNDESLGVRFPDMSDCYNKELRQIAKKCAKKLDIDLKEGIYLATTGPSYETPAEVRFFKSIGADAIGMSTAPEAIVANYLKMKIVAFSTLTNYATGITDKTLSHQEVLDAGKIAGHKLNLLIKEIIKEI